MAIPHPVYALTSLFQQSFFIPPATLTAENLPDLTSHVSLITGGYTGLGLEVASLLYSRNATVWIAGRSETKAASAIEKLQSTHPDSKGQIHFLNIDLSDLASIKPAIADFTRRNDQIAGGEGKGTLNWLNNNAGVMIPPKGSQGKQGFDLQLVTNVYGPFLLTKGLEPVLRRTAELEGKDGRVRVSWAGSAASFLSPGRGGVGWEKDEKEVEGALTDPQRVYGITKSWNWWLAREFGRRGEGEGVLHNSYNPGNLRTELQRTMKEVQGNLAHFIITKWLCHDAINGAYTEIFAGLSPDLSLAKGDQGVWIIPWGRKSTMRPDMLEEAEKGEKGLGGKLWDWCEGIVKEYE